ncbi:hypothetical protein KKF38_04580, partial [Patescibacteria group bacterium]|nr:hypothetical protein [Patescibacteria group bacterium]
KIMNLFEPKKLFVIISLLLLILLLGVIFFVSNYKTHEFATNFYDLLPEQEIIKVPDISSIDWEIEVVEE